MTTKTTAFGTYTIRSSTWSVRCNNGASISKGLGKLAAAKAMHLTMLAEKIPRNGQKSRRLSLDINMTGFELNAEFGGDVIEAATGISVSYSKPDLSNSVPVYLNRKFSADMQTHDFIGPCALITYSAGEITAGKSIAKKRGKTFLLVNMGRVIADRSPDWLQRVVDGTEGKSTLGGCFLKFNEDGSPLNNARAAISLDTTDFSAALKVKAAGVGFFSGQITLRHFE